MAYLILLTNSVIGSIMVINKNSDDDFLYYFFSRISEQEQRQFFLDCFEFAAQRYGRENIIAATVHLDEATPHLHLDFVPLTSDGRPGQQHLL